MKKATFYFLSAVLLTLSITSCGNSSKNQQKIEEEAVATSSVSTGNLSAAMKATLHGMTNNLKALEFQKRLNNGEIKITGNPSSSFLPLASLDTIHLRDAQLRAIGILSVDYVAAISTKQPTDEIRAELGRLLIHTDMTDLMKKQEKLNNLEDITTMEDMDAHKNAFFNNLIDNEKLPEAIHFMLGSCVETACLAITNNYKVTGEVDKAITQSLLDELNLLERIIGLTAIHYPELKSPLTKVSQLKTLIPDLETARKNKDKILALRADILQ